MPPSTTTKTTNSTASNNDNDNDNDKVNSRQIAYGSFNNDCNNGATSSSAICDDDDNDDARINSGSNRMEHLGQHRQYARDMILGVNDGIISTFLLVAGVSGSGLTTDDIFFTAVAGALAGAVSMSAGEYIATKSQNEVLQGEIGLEKLHIRDFHEEELKELTGDHDHGHDHDHIDSGTGGGLFNIIGIPPESKQLRQQLVEHYRNDKSALLRLMVALEFGVVEDEERSPWTAAIFSGLLFFVGSLPSVIPFAFSVLTPQEGLFIAAGCTSIALLVVGGIKTWATRGNCVTAAIENLSVAGFGGIIAYFVGQLVQRIVR